MIMFACYLLKNTIIWSHAKISSMKVPYDEHDNSVMASNIFQRLCEMDELDRSTWREPAWHDIRTLANEIKGYDKSTDVAYIAEEFLLEQDYIERDPHTNNVRCGRKVDKIVVKELIYSLQIYRD
jgi:hypothetical protein